MLDPVGLRARRTQRNRQAIVDAALRLFGERGFDGTSVEQIAAAADVAPRTFYRYFPTKEDVLFEDPGGEVALRRVLSERQPGEGDAHLVARAMLEAMRVHEERVTRVRALLESTPALHGRALQRMARTADLIADRLLEGRPRGRAARFRAQVLAQAVGAAVRAAFFAWLDGGRRGSPWVVCEQALEVLRDGLDGGPPRGGRAARAAHRVPPLAHGHAGGAVASAGRRA